MKGHLYFKFLFPTKVLGHILLLDAKEVVYRKSCGIIRVDFE